MYTQAGCTKGWFFAKKWKCVAEYVHKYATREAADEAGEDSEEADEMSSVGSYESGDEDPAGTMEV